MKVPSEIRSQLINVLWRQADDLNWAHMSPRDKSIRYAQWAQDEEIGGILTRYMAQSQVRNYLKNSLLGGYGRAKLAEEDRPLRVLGANGARVVERFDKPHGALLDDGRMVAWGPARSWKAIILALFERCHGREDAVAHGAAMLLATGRYGEVATRNMVEAAADRLGVGRVTWLES